MKKYLIAGIIALIMIMPISGAVNIFSTNEVEETQINNLGADFTHAVIGEYVTTTSCPHCPTASSQLYSIYDSGDYDFYYVTMVADENPRVYNRASELGVTAVPDVYFDGGYENILGEQVDEQPYRNAIVQCGEREVPDIGLDVDVVWKGNGILKITVTIENNEPEEFDGHLRVYIVEPESRWDDSSSNPYHFGVLDIPIDRDAALVQGQPKPLGDTYTFTRTWFGSLYGFGDITEDNTMVIAAVFEKDSDYAVQTAAAEPTTSEGFQFIFSGKLINLLLQLIRENGILSRLLNLS